MNNRVVYLLMVLGLSMWSCGNNDLKPDAYGNFESDEILVSAMVPGEIMSFNLEDGTQLKEGEVVGQIDTIDMHLQRLEVQANIELINKQHNNIAAQIKVMQAEKENLIREIERVKKLLKNEAATPQQFDDLEGKLKVVENQIKTLEVQNPTVVGQIKVMLTKEDQLKEKINKATIVSPINGVVLNKIANTHELASPGVPLFKVADLSALDFRGYVMGNQLTSIEIGSKCKVMVDGIDGQLMEFPGEVTWISDQAEFTPKIIQTREERVDMVYAVKVRVANDGRLKIGMPGELFLNSTANAENQ